MSARICPFCNRSLRPFEHYFCSTCGKSLPKEVICPLQLPVMKRSRTESKKTVLKLPSFLKTLNKKKLIGLGFIAVGILCVVLIAVNVVPKIPNIGFFNTSNTKLIEDSLEVQTVKQDFSNKVVISQSDYKSGSFGLSEFAQMVPFDTDLYMEVTDIGWLTVNADFFDETLSDMLRGSAIPFCIFAYENEDGYVTWSFMFEEQPDIDLDALFDALPSEYWSYKVISGKVVVSGVASVFDAVQKASDGLAKNYTMNSFYAKALASSEREGRALIIMSGYEGKKILNDLVQREEWGNLTPLLVQALNLGYNEVVIR